MVSGSSVAVVIPCYNQRNFLASAIESALDQSLPAAEIIVVDDGNEENLSDFTRLYPAITLLRQANRGLAGARNSGLRACTAQRVIFLDADDRLGPNAIKAGLRCFDDNPGAAFVYGAYVEEGGSARRLMFMPAAGRLDLLRFNCVAMIATAMFERAPLLQQGGFDETLGMCEDWDAFLRLSRSHSFAAHPQVVARYALHPGNMSNDVRELKRWMNVVRAKEQDRGLGKDELKAWRDGEKAIDAIYPEATLRGLSRRAYRKALRLIGLGQYVPCGTINRRLASHEQ
jgi:glycosyltransferase involved in cell wall biosynthesis